MAPRWQFGPKALAESIRNLRARKTASQAEPKRRPKSNHILGEAIANCKAKQNKNEVKGEARVKPSQAQAKPEESESESKQSRSETEAKPSNLKQSQTEPMRANAREMKKTDIGQA